MMSQISPSSCATLLSQCSVEAWIFGVSRYLLQDVVFFLKSNRSFQMLAMLIGPLSLEFIPQGCAQVSFLRAFDTLVNPYYPSLPQNLPILLLLFPWVCGSKGVMVAGGGEWPSTRSPWWLRTHPEVRYWVGPGSTEMNRTRFWTPGRLQFNMTDN